MSFILRLGMGELHLEVIGERIKTEYKIDIDLSRPRISYKEGLISEAKEDYQYNLKIGKLLYFSTRNIEKKIKKLNLLNSIQYLHSRKPHISETTIN